MKNILTSIRALVLYTFFLGLIYPVLMYGVGLTLFPNEILGSFVKNKNEVIGSKLIGQKFVLLKYFWSRPSAVDYNASASGGSNFGPTHAELLKQVAERRHTYVTQNGREPEALEITTSASGLDPHISVQAAINQADRIAKARSIPKEEVVRIIENSKEAKTFGILGEERLNVLEANLRLDGLR